MVFGAIIGAVIFGLLAAVGGGALINAIGAGAAQIGIFVISLAIAVVGGILALVFGFAVDFAQWAMTMTTQIPIIHGWAYNVGWIFTRDLTNILFIIVFAFIGLATILRIKEYEVGKILPRLLIVALLVNFSPVLVGLVVDIFNILTNFFLNNALANMKNWQLALAPLATATGDIGNNVWSFSGSFTQMIANLFGIVAECIFFLLGIFVFLTMGLIFIVRVLAFWILLILAPFAFAAYILPTTRRWWSMWLNQLIQWGAIGLTTSFFVYLGFHLLASSFSVFEVTQLKAAFAGGTDASSLPAGFAGLLASLFPYGVALIFMFIGIMAGMQTGAQGANMVINFGNSQARKWTKRAGTWAGRQTKDWTQQKLSESERVQRTAQRMAMTTGHDPFRSLYRKVGQTFGPNLIETQKEKIAASEKKTSGKALDKQLTELAAAINQSQRLGIINSIIESNNIEDAMNVGRYGNAAITNAQIEGLYDYAVSQGKNQNLRAAFPNVARRHLPAGTPAGPIPPGINQDQYEAEYILERIKTADYDKMSRSVIGDPNTGTPGDDAFLAAMLRRGTDEHVNAFRKRFGIDAALALEQRLTALATAAGMTPRQFLQHSNPRLYRYFTRGAGQGLINI